MTVKYLYFHLKCLNAFSSILYFGQHGFKILFQNTFEFPDYMYRIAFCDGIGLDIWSTVRPLHLSVLYGKYGYWRCPACFK